MDKQNLNLSPITDVPDIFSEYRDRVFYRFGLVVVVLILPFSIIDFINGEFYLGTVILCLVLMLAFNSLNIYLGRSASVSIGILILTLAVTIGVAVYVRGFSGVIWTYPSIVFVSFAVEQRKARIYTAILFVYFSALFLYVFEIPFVIRSVIGLLITILFANLFLNVIERLREKLIEQTITDPLTGALNRRDMDARLGEAIERKRRTKTPASLLLLDIDHFKRINDDFGHAAGDIVLREFVKLVQDRSRKLDQLFRTGGEEFLLFLPDTPEAGAAVLAEAIRSVVSTAELIEGRKVTTSIGISELLPEETIDDWIKRADNAVYKAKELGRDQVFSGSTITT